ncbi:MAG TPA: hypothetical protein VN625_05565, partial [Desulfuromonadaceae bacterium]|nr:hypothetical protein [Desulfuromonadaceae bacterium]
MKRIVLQLSASIVFFANASSVFASATVSTLANASVSADTVGGAYTTLTGPQLDEAVNGDIHAPGTIVLRAPAGFIFDTTSTVTVTVSRLNASSSALLTLSNATAAVSSNAITVGVASADGSSGNPKPLARLVWSGIKVRPTAGTPLASGTITSSGTASIIGVSGTTSFGSLTERPGNAVSLTAGGYGLTRTAGQNGTLTVTAKDQFGNTATNYTGTVHISTTDSQATPPADYTFSAVDAGV